MPKTSINQPINTIITMATIALDIGGTKIASAIFLPDGSMLFNRKRLLKGRTGHEVGKLAAEILAKPLTIARRSRIQIDGVGVCVPGIVYSQTGRVWAPNIPGWENYPLQEVLRTVTAPDIGAGIIIDGHVLHGANDIIGATGWMALQPPYKEAYDACGCFEYYASGNGIGARVRDAVRANKAYKGRLRQKPICRISAYDVFNAYNESDPIAVSVLHKAIEMWGMASANLVSLLNPQKIIWGGGVFGPASIFIDDIYKEACKWAQPLSIKQVEFVASQLSGNAGLIGAAFLAIKKHLYE